MPLLSTLDLVALAWFFGAWVVYSLTLSFTEQRRRGLNSEMDRYRDTGCCRCSGARCAWSTRRSWRRCRTAPRSSPPPR